MTKVNAVKFSYNIARGSNAERLAKSQDMSTQLFSSLIEKYGCQECVQKKDLNKLYTEFLPEKIRFYFSKLSKIDAESTDGEMRDYYDDYLNLCRYVLKLPFRKNQLFQKDWPLLMHETTHIFDSALRPKTIRTKEKMFAGDLDKLTFDLYDEHYYDDNMNYSAFKDRKTLRNIKELTLKKIDRLSTAEKLLVLKYMKEELETELNASKVEKECSELLNAYCGFKLAETDQSQFIKENGFEEKIDLLNKMISKIISEERYKNATEQPLSRINKLKLYLTYCFKSIM